MRKEKSFNFRRLFFFSVFIVFVFGCSSNDKSPPKAFFRLSDEQPAQWDRVELISKATGDNTYYQITGGAFVLESNLSTLMFLEPGDYSITQVSENPYGTDRYTLDVTVSPPDNKYQIGDIIYPIRTVPVIQKSGDRTTITFVNDVDNQQYPDIISIFPVNGNNELPAKYLYNGNGNHVGTYLLHISKNFNSLSDPYDWTMDAYGNDGAADLIIEKIYKDPVTPENSAYEIRIENYILSTGYYDFISGGGFVESQKRTCSIVYRGVLNGN